MKIVEIYNVNKTEANSAFNSINQVTKSHPLLKSLLSIVPKYKKNFTEQFTSLNSLIIARGGQYDQNGKSLSTSQLWQEFEMIKKFLNPVQWNPYTVDFWTSKNILNEPGSIASNKGTGLSNKSNNLSLTFALNRNKCVEYLEDVYEKATRKFNNKAYLHWYHKFDISDEHFQDAFENVRLIIDSYVQMTK